jgi:hypothetical protein
MDVYEVPPPYPSATLVLPDDAGSVRVRILRVGKSDVLETDFFVEMPVWEGWSRHVNGEEVTGIAPTKLLMWAPRASVLLGDAEVDRIHAVVSEGLTSKMQAHAQRSPRPDSPSGAGAFCTC